MEIIFLYLKDQSDIQKCIINWWWCISIFCDLQWKCSNCLLSKPISYGHRENCHICRLILVTGVPLAGQKKGLGQRCLNDKNDFMATPVTFYVQLVICRLQVCEWPMLQIIWRIEMDTYMICPLSVDFIWKIWGENSKLISPFICNISISDILEIWDMV